MVSQRWSSPKQLGSLTLLSVIPSALVIALLVVARLSGVLQQLELTAFDWMLRSRPAEPIDSRVTIIGINESDIARMGSYPISDQALADLLLTLQSYEPSVIGVDIFRDLAVPSGNDAGQDSGAASLEQVFLDHPNTIAIQTILPGAGGNIVPPPSFVPAEQVGFGDFLLDRDGAIRRSLLGSLDLQDQFQLSLAVQLANIYLSEQGSPLQNSERDPDAMQFGNTEIPRFQTNAGAYVRASAGGVQTLLNFRSGRQPFRRVSLEDLETGAIEADWFHNRIILIGVTAESAKDIVVSAAVNIENPSLFYGVEAQAHAVSQIVSAVEDGRPLLQVWAEPWEFAWIIVWGVLGFLLGRWGRSPLRILGAIGLASIILMALCYGSLLSGWWIPFVPALAGLVLNGTGLAAAALYRQEQDLRTRLIERQTVIEQTFNSIHNGPLQTLATLLKRAAQSEAISTDFYEGLAGLNKELRDVYEAVRKEALTDSDRLYLTLSQELDLNAPLHELLYDVYSSVLERKFPGFQSLKIKVVKFEPMDDRNLTVEQRRSLCRFLEEALCNVGKHALSPTRIQVTCIQNQGKNQISVVDNGKDSSSILEPQPPLPQSSYKSGMGTQQAKALAKELGGTYERSPRTPHGTQCELLWPPQHSKRHVFRWQRLNGGVSTKR
ncbi:MAG: CHASE2 domain-containing protein [Cyanobacteria bacterium J06638_22]